MGFFTAPKLSYGPGAIEQLSALGARKALLIVDPNLAKADRHRRIVEEFTKTETSVEVWSGPPEDPTTDDLEPGVAVARSFGPDWIVAVGGGSTIDAAKGVWVRHERPDLTLESITPLVELGLRTRCRFVAVPTTSGSGAEASWTAMFRRPGAAPLEIGSRELVPDWALLDPSLPASMPMDVTAESGADLLAHALESLASEWSSPFSDALAIGAVSIAASALPKVAKHPGDGELRGALHYAATMAGVAASNSQVGVTHALAYALASEFRVPHGRLVGVLLPYVLEFNFPAARDRYAPLAPALGPAALQNRASLPERVRQILDPTGMPATLAAAGIPPEELRSRLDPLAERAASTTAAVSNPRVASLEELKLLLTTAAEGGHVTF